MKWTYPKQRELERLWFDFSLNTAQIGERLGGYSAVAIQCRAYMLGLPDRRRINRKKQQTRSGAPSQERVEYLSKGSQAAEVTNSVSSQRTGAASAD